MAPLFLLSALWYSYGYPMADRTGTRAVKFVLADLIGDVAYFPLWWYSRGAARAVRSLASGMQETARSLALRVWLKNLFVPMYGQYDLQGRIISFFMRLFQIIVRSLAAFFWLLIRVAVFVIYLAVPPFVAYLIVVNLFRFFGNSI